MVEPELEALAKDDKSRSEEKKTDGDVINNEGEDQEESTEQEFMEAAKPTKSADRSEDLTPLTDEECLLTTPWVIGMDLKTKKWGEHLSFIYIPPFSSQPSLAHHNVAARFPVDGIEDVEWNDAAFDNLVVPGGEKQLAWDFVEGKNIANDSYDDFIPGKGKFVFTTLLSTR